jgi:hypothetical protein
VCLCCGVVDGNKKMALLKISLPRFLADNATRDSFMLNYVGLFIYLFDLV